ncbi:MAG: hypothetical protein QXR45_14670 [Candidatus Bathyarchaeia archaeon]
MVFQITGTDGIYGLGLIKSTYYDDQMPIWDKELKEVWVLYPWRIELAFVAYF